MTVQGLPIADVPSDITVEWLDAALRAGGHLESGAVTGVELAPLGTGQMSDAFRVRATYDRGDAGPPTLIAKLPATDETSRTTALALRSYEKEVRFYQELLPALSVRAPRCFHAAIEPETARFTLLLDDLHPAAQGDQLVGCTSEVAESALEQLVPLHAPHWNDAGLLQHEWLIGDVEVGRDVSRMVLPMLWGAFVDRYRAELDPIVTEAGTCLFGNLEPFIDTGSAAVSLTHGDYRLDNLLIAADRAEVVGIVDWQTCAYAPAMRDVAYVLGAGLLPEERRANEADLVRGYHEALVDAGVADYGWDEAWRDYRAGTWAGLIMAVGASMMVERTERGDEMFMAMATRHAQHAHDLDADELLTGGA